MNAIGGYFSLELNENKERHVNAIRLNAGRYALEYILKARQYKKVYLPYYICDTVLQPFMRLGVDYEFYHINEFLEPVINIIPHADEAVLYVNYFGLKNHYASTFCSTFPNTILDQTQAFYNDEGNCYGNSGVKCDTIYSCRKFFGVPDGAYLYTNCHLEEELPQDESFERMTFLTKRIDQSAQEGYNDFRASSKELSMVGMKRMSKLTEAMMRGIDYTRKANLRIQNFYTLDNMLKSSNQFKYDMDHAMVPMVYPYLVEDGAKLRQHLIDHQVFCARYWPDVLERCKPDEWEYRLAENLVCLPIDQRYVEEDMYFILDCINTYFGAK